MLNKRQDAILDILRLSGPATRESMERSLQSRDFSASKVTLLRDLDKLMQASLVEKTGTGKSTRYALGMHSALTLPFDPDAYFAKDADQRSLRSETFRFDIFDELHHLLSDEDIAAVHALNDRFRRKKALLTPRLLQKECDRITIELAWKSSRIEGNTYSLLDTERLLRENIAAEGKTAEETAMVLNHKHALDYVWEQPSYFRTVSVAKIEELHALITEGLGVAKGIRSGMVGIVGTNYRPLDNPFQIREALERLAALINAAAEPVEKALLAVLMVSYIQPFEDGNKRTARILGNAILLAHDWCPLSYRSVDEIAYKKAVILFYEQNSIACFRQLFLEQFRLAAEKYF